MEEQVDLKKLKMTPPWEWPEETDKALLEVLNNNRADPADRVLAAELVGDFVVINDELAGALLSILQTGSEPEELRAAAAISLGPVLEHACIEEFDARMTFRSPRVSFTKFRNHSKASTWTLTFPRMYAADSWRHRFVLHSPGIRTPFVRPMPVIMRIGS